MRGKKTGRSVYCSAPTNVARGIELPTVLIFDVARVHVREISNERAFVFPGAGRRHAEGLADAAGAQPRTHEVCLMMSIPQDAMEM